MAVQDPAVDSAGLSFTDAGSDLVHPMFQLNAESDGVVCLRSAVSMTEQVAFEHDVSTSAAQATRFYVESSLITRHTQAFNDILAASNEHQAVIRLPEDSITLEYLLGSIQENLNDYPDLLELNLAGLNELYKAAFKYGIVPVQNLAEHCIRLRMQITILRTPTFHEKLANILVTAYTFRRLLFFKEAAAIVANMRKSLREKVIETLSANIGPKGVNLFMAEQAKLEREKRQGLFSGVMISTETVEAFDDPSDVEDEAEKGDDISELERVEASNGNGKEH